MLCTRSYMTFSNLQCASWACLSEDFHLVLVSCAEIVDPTYIISVLCELPEMATRLNHIMVNCQTDQIFFITHTPPLYNPSTSLVGLPFTLICFRQQIFSSTNPQIIPNAELTWITYVISSSLTH